MIKCEFCESNSLCYECAIEAIQRVAALHLTAAWDDVVMCIECQDEYYPCRTMQALTGRINE